MLWVCGSHSSTRGNATRLRKSHSTWRQLSTCAGLGVAKLCGRRRFHRNGKGGAPWWRLFLCCVSAAEDGLAQGHGGGVMMAYFVESFWVGKCRGPVPLCRESDREGTLRWSAVQSSWRTFCRSNLDSYVTLGTGLGPCLGECGGGMGVAVLSAALCLLHLPRLASPQPG